MVAEFFKTSLQLFVVNFCVLQVYGSIVPPSTCHTPIGEDGYCIGIRNCERLVNLVMKHDLTNEEITFLRKSKCNSVSKGIFVCCPKNETPNDLIKEEPTTQEYAVTSEPKPLNNAQTTETLTKTTTEVPALTASCQTSSGAYGDCVPIQTCGFLVNLARKPGVTDEEISFIKKSQCGFHNKTVLVCCPKNETPNDLLKEEPTTQEYGATSEPKPLNNAQTTETLTKTTTEVPALTASCQAPSGAYGDCVPIQTCGFLFNLARKPGVTDEEISFIKKSQCGFHNKTVLVCCPKNETPNDLLKEEPTTQEYGATSEPKPLNNAQTTETLTKTTTEVPALTASCQAPSGAYGDCVPIQTCGFLFNLARKPGVTDEEISFIKKSQCGFHNKTVLVCCPKNKAPNELPQKEPTTQGKSEPEPLSNAQPPETHAKITATVPALTTSCQTPSGAYDDFIPIQTNIKPTNSSGRATLPTQPECGAIAVTIGKRIYGGSKTDINEYPWTALIKYGTNDDEPKFFCGGSLINKYYVLTAAHCVHDDDLTPGWYIDEVRLGEWNLRSAKDCDNTINSEPEGLCAPPHSDYDIDGITIHPQYNIRTRYSDIALIRLANQVEYTNFISPICLPLTVEQQMNSHVGAKVDIAGWGVTEKNKTSEIKLKAQVTILSEAQCKGRNLRKRLDLQIDKQICATGDDGVDSCNGDSGGPLMLEEHDAYYLLGVVSFGAGECGQRGTRGIYTRVGAYIDWIKYEIEK